MKFLIAAALALAPVLAHAETLELVCYGTSRYSQDTTGKVSTSDFWGEKTTSRVTVAGTAESRGAVHLRIHDNSWGEIKIPSELVPALRSSSNDGWRPLSELALSENEIRARFKLNAINKPSVQVDRRTGDMELSGWGGGFRGSCEKAPDASAPKKF